MVQTKMYENLKNEKFFNSKAELKNGNNNFIEYN